MCGRGWFVFLITLVRKILNRKRPLETRSKGSEEVNNANIWGKSITRSKEQVKRPYSRPKVLPPISTWEVGVFPYHQVIL